jgi:hypothetical protein
MRFEDLSPVDQTLLKTDFGSLDKVAAEQIKTASEMFNAGAEMALAAADQMDKLAAEEKEHEEEKEECDEEKKASADDKGMFICEGFIDKLAELGEERHGNPAHYIMPYAEDKIAQAGAHAALSKFASAKEGFTAMLKSKAKDAGAVAKNVGAAAKKGAGDAVAKGKDVAAKNPGRAAAAAGAAGVGAGYATSKLLSKKKES